MAYSSKEHSFLGSLFLKLIEQVIATALRASKFALTLHKSSTRN